MNRIVKKTASVLIIFFVSLINVSCVFFEESIDDFVESDFSKSPFFINRDFFLGSNADQVAYIKNEGIFGVILISSFKEMIGEKITRLIDFTKVLELSFVEIKPFGKAGGYANHLGIKLDDANYCSKLASKDSPINQHNNFHEVVCMDNTLFFGLVVEPEERYSGVDSPYLVGRFSASELFDPILLKYGEKIVFSGISIRKDASLGSFFWSVFINSQNELSDIFYIDHLSDLEKIELIFTSLLKESLFIVYEDNEKAKMVYTVFLDFEALKKMGIDQIPQKAVDSYETLKKRGKMKDTTISLNENLLKIVFVLDKKRFIGIK